MSAFCPEFSAYWLSEGEPVSGRENVESAPREQHRLSPAQQVALEELVERVNAARSVV